MGIKITGGELRSRRLRSPKGTDVRPTAARVREALFSVLGQRLDGLSVLDLFAGAGTLGIEAVSRGADRVVFVDRDRASARLLKENAELVCGLAEVEILTMDVHRALGLLARRGDRFDLVFLDPPYRTTDALRTVEELGRSPATLIAEGGRVVAETDVEDEVAPSLGELVEVQRRVYGQTAITLYAKENR